MLEVWSSFVALSEFDASRVMIGHMKINQKAPCQRSKLTSTTSGQGFSLGLQVLR
jgi:hypothetical protein